MKKIICCIATMSCLLSFVRAQENSLYSQKLILARGNYSERPAPPDKSANPSALVLFLNAPVLKKLYSFSYIYFEESGGSRYLEAVSGAGYSGKHVAFGVMAGPESKGGSGPRVVALGKVFFHRGDTAGSFDAEVFYEQGPGGQTARGEFYYSSFLENFSRGHICLYSTKIGLGLILENEYIGPQLRLDGKDVFFVLAPLLWNLDYRYPRAFFIRAGITFGKKE